VTLMAALVAGLVLALPATGEEQRRRRARKPPRIKHAQMVDSDGNMFADKVVVTYNERVRHKRDADGKYPFTVDGYDIASVGRAKGRKITIKLEEATLPDGLAIPSVKYRRVKKQAVRDRARHQARKQTFTKTRPFADAVVVTVNREGDGTVASLPLPFINCGEECTAAFPKGLPITLNASDPAVEWGGDCAGATGADLPADARLGQDGVGDVRGRRRREHVHADRGEGRHERRTDRLAAARNRLRDDLHRGVPCELAGGVEREHVAGHRHVVGLSHAGPP
jgi:hypothetical protein